MIVISQIFFMVLVQSLLSKSWLINAWYILKPTCLILQIINMILPLVDSDKKCTTVVQDVLFDLFHIWERVKNGIRFKFLWVEQNPDNTLSWLPIEKYASWICLGAKQTSVVTWIYKNYILMKVQSSPESFIKIPNEWFLSFFPFQ